MNEPVRLHLFITGRVQGVGFRYFVQENAVRLGLTGWVRNLWDERVEIITEGDHEKLVRLFQIVQTGSASSSVADVKAEWSPATGEFTQFSILASF